MFKELDEGGLDGAEKEGETKEGDLPPCPPPQRVSPLARKLPTASHCGMIFYFPLFLSKTFL